ncbi:YciI family protein [Pseudoxanthomonas sp. NC8]|nr:YciI family protein [Pseudoxanthomonas sp. NC8]
MKYLLLVYTDPDLLEALPAAEYDAHMRGCIRDADALHAKGTLLGSNKLESPAQARTVRVREGRTSVFDGPFAETKEVLAGYNLIEAGSMEEAVELARKFPWARYGAMEVRPVADMDAERVRVGA